MMDLKQYLQAKSLRQEQFAKNIGVSQSVVSRLARGVMNPGPELARKIHDQTGGEVPFWSWSAYRPFAPDKDRAA